MAPHSSTLAWKIPWMEEPGRLQSMGLLRVEPDWATSLSLFTFMHWRRKWHPLQCSCLENPRDGGAWWADVYGVTQSRTRLKWLSSSSINLQLRYFSTTPSCASNFQCVPKVWENKQSFIWLFNIEIHIISVLGHIKKTRKKDIFSGWFWFVWFHRISHFLIEI